MFFSSLSPFLVIDDSLFDFLNFFFAYLLPDAKLCGADIASVNVDLLHTLRVSMVEERERLLSAIYAELHPPTRRTQRLDALLGTGSLT